MEKLIIVGCGAGGVFTALETLELNKDIKIFNHPWCKNRY